jgi:hypothetical protein
MNKSEQQLKYECELIDRYYPGLSELTKDEIIYFDQYDSLHDFQYYIAVCRKLKLEERKEKVIVGSL